MAAPLRKSCCRILQKPWTSVLQRHHQNMCQYMTAHPDLLKLQEDRGIFQNVFPATMMDDLRFSLNRGNNCLYCGFDPTAPSLHVGNLLPLIGLMHARRAGHQTIVLLGGATAQIGDPSGKTEDRDPLDLETIQENVSRLKEQISTILNNHDKYFTPEKSKRAGSPTIILDNAEWYSNRNVVEFLSKVGRHFRMGTLLRRSSVESRLNSPAGMSLTEFTYQVFQAYDWLHLYRKHNCTIQIGGNDQIGNISAGHEFINRVADAHIWGLTVPLIKSATGDKLGKTAGNALWLDGDRTSPFDFYQHFINIPDDDVLKLLKLFTFLSDGEIQDLMNRHRSSPESRIPQKKLAEEATRLVHGDAGVGVAIKCTQLLRSNDPKLLVDFSEDDLRTVFSGAPWCQLTLDPGTSVLDMCMAAKCFNREVDADRVICQGGVRVNFIQCKNPKEVLVPGVHILLNNCTLIRIGKKSTFYMVKWRS